MLSSTAKHDLQNTNEHTCNYLHYATLTWNFRDQFQTVNYVFR